MSYFQFHVLFVMPALILTFIFALRHLRRLRRHGWFALGLNALLALIYTTPWDNYLVFKSIWTYGPDRVVALIGYVPLEEYLFFILQTLITGFFTVALLPRFMIERHAMEAFDKRATRRRGAILFFTLTVVGIAALFFEPTLLYLGLILVWASPVMIIQWAFGGDLLMHSWRKVGMAILLPTPYLWFADGVALRQQIWTISTQYTIGVNIADILPIEEALFFLLTNTLVVFGVFLFLHPHSRLRLRRCRLT